MRYRLILQLPASSMEDYDRIVELEEKLVPTLGNLGNVDGNDMGSGDANIFILTDQPELAFGRLRSTLENVPDLKVAYHEVGKMTLQFFTRLA